MSPLVSQGIDLVIYGMGTVFVFLTLLVIATVTMSRLTQMTLTELPATQRTENKDGASRKLAAITAAIHAHRQKQQ